MAGKRASLSEIMGKKAAKLAGKKLTVEDLPDLLGEAMPDLPKNAVGRYRLIRGLKARFGPNFRSLPGVSDIVKDFDSVVDTEKKVASIKGIRMKDFKRSK